MYSLLPVIPENTRNTWKYPKTKKTPGNTLSYNLTLLPNPNPTRYPVFCPIPDPTRYWKTLPAGHWCQIVPLCLFRKKIIRISYGVIKCLIGINSKRIHGQSLFYLEGDGGGYDDGGGYNDDDADDDNGDGGGYIQLTIMIATCRSHRGFCAGFAV